MTLSSLNLGTKLKFCFHTWVLLG